MHSVECQHIEHLLKEANTCTHYGLSAQVIEHPWGGGGGGGGDSYQQET